MSGRVGGILDILEMTEIVRRGLDSELKASKFRKAWLASFIVVRRTLRRSMLYICSMSGSSLC